MSLRLEFVETKAARYACERYHYSKCLPRGKLVSVGVWEYGLFIGCVIFSRGARSIGSKFRVADTQIAELARIALTSHESACTRIVRIAIKKLREVFTGIEVLVSYADSMQSHHGGIYQAGNWVYTGDTSPSKMYKAPNGKILHSRIVSRTGYKAQFGSQKRVWKPEECKVIECTPKHRYAIAFSDSARHHLESMRVDARPKKYAGSKT